MRLLNVVRNKTAMEKLKQLVLFFKFISQHFVT